MKSDQIIDELSALVTEVEEGNTDALKAYIELKKINKVLEAASKQIGENAMKEAKTYGEKSFQAFGAEVQVKEGAARFSFKHIPQWNEFEKKKKTIEDAAKNRYKNNSLIIADENGEEIPMAECTYDKESIAITIKGGV
jgi:hypothetical protein